jgi:hypothetical protein
LACSSCPSRTPPRQRAHLAGLDPGRLRHVVGKHIIGVLGCGALLLLFIRPRFIGVCAQIIAKREMTVDLRRPIFERMHVEQALLGGRIIARDQAPARNAQLTAP